MLWLRPFVAILALLVVYPVAWAQSTPEFPELTGRVVDRAEMLPSKVESDLTRILAAHEEATTNQVVVVTLPDLQGRNIEEYGYQLGRHWGIGQEGEDNGALLIVAEQERAVRIEVGYGLEGQLTDAASSTIINRIITPAFRQGDFAGGIVQGTEAMIQVLGGNPLNVPAAQTSQREKPNVGAVIMFFVIIVAFIGLVGGGGRGGRGRGALVAGALLGAGMGGRGGGFGGGGFGGGGGGFGGGGASGGW
ncbi:uncharacterized protein SAMN05216203_2103 [Marinobacter daqiaonensis]|uniref:TPM domain-containing protein n=1 Tax=Marinobacter daqiaonensis TaxID=650891 RepID=A0A1I6IDG3_9GAMM|nr:TPM domain-containing protein [Marinobacter daqiaonensis]SFR64400.1 uncharacterized protein SAMN05216203_2103 [Marinobacter daqiaonensis]